MILMWVIDIRVMLDESLTRPAHRIFGSKLKALSRIISYATARSIGITVKLKPKCWRRPQRKACGGVLKIELRNEFIHWVCPLCKDEGVVTGWKNLMWDLSVFSTSAVQ